MKNNKDYISSLLSNNGYIAVNRVLIKLLGLNCAVLIGELCSEYNYYSETNQLTNKEWFYSTSSNIEENTGLNRYFQDESIKKLIQNNIITTKLMGMPSKKYFKINFSELEKIFKNAKNNTNKDKKMPKIQGCDRVANKVVKESQTRLQESRKQGCERVANKVVKESQARLQESSKQGCEPVANKVVKESQTRLRESRKHDCKPVATNNNNNNNKLININNNLILSKKDEIRKDKKNLVKGATMPDNWNDYDIFLNNLQQFHKNIGINNLQNLYNDKPLSNNMFKEVVSLCESVLTNNQKYYIISGSKVLSNKFIDRILKLNAEHIEYIVESLSNNTTKIKNIKAYMLATIYNSIDTIEIYYKNQVNYDMANNLNKKDIFVA